MRQGEWMGRNLLTISMSCNIIFFIICWLFLDEEGRVVWIFLITFFTQSPLQWYQLFNLTYFERDMTVVWCALNVPQWFYWLTHKKLSKWPQLTFQHIIRGMGDIIYHDLQNAWVPWSSVNGVLPRQHTGYSNQCRLSYMLYRHSVWKQHLWGLGLFWLEKRSRVQLALNN